VTGRLRITGGALARRLIDVPQAAARGLVRPTSDRVREALFSSLGSRLAGGFVGLDVADLCCGSGALGFEALSRGARHCVFLDADKRTLATATANAASLGVSDRCRFTLASLDMAAATLGTGLFDLVLCDPPYALSLTAAWPAIAATVRSGGLLVLERATKGARADLPASALSLVDERRYGDTTLLVFSAEPNPAS
jgi:16S rRNA (guanine966-N2)-methyltransferase